MSQLYKIIRWDPILNNNSIDPKPIISIKPDKNFNIFSNQRKNVLLIKISNTKSIYDNKNIIGIVDKKNIIQDGTVSIVLQSDWYGYPDFNGECQIFGLEEGASSETINEVTLKKIKDQKSKITNTHTIIAVFIGIIFIFLASLFLHKNK
jgi:hypothetical protein